MYLTKYIKNILTLNYYNNHWGILQSFFISNLQSLVCFYMYGVSKFTLASPRFWQPCVAAQVQKKTLLVFLEFLMWSLVSRVHVCVCVCMRACMYVHARNAKVSRPQFLKYWGYWGWLKHIQTKKRWFLYIFYLLTMTYLWRVHVS